MLSHFEFRDSFEARQLAQTSMTTGNTTSSIPELVVLPVVVLVLMLVDVVVVLVLLLGLVLDELVLLLGSVAVLLLLLVVVWVLVVVLVSQLESLSVFVFDCVIWFKIPSRKIFFKLEPIFDSSPSSSSTNPGVPYEPQVWPLACFL